MGSPSETQRRLALASEIASQITDQALCVVVGGSVGYGADSSVKPETDVDMPIVCSIENIGGLMSNAFFRNGAPEAAVSMFADGVIGFFNVSRIVDGIEVNTFIYEPRVYEEFCLQRSGVIGFKTTKPPSTQDAYLFDATHVMFDRDVRAHEGGFLYEKPALLDGRFYGGMPRNDYLIRSVCVWEHDSFFQAMRERVWSSVITRLIAEHGPEPDVTQFNVLNSLYAYSHKRHQVPPDVQEAVRQETSKRLLAQAS